MIIMVAIEAAIKIFVLGKSCNLCHKLILKQTGIIISVIIMTIEIVTVIEYTSLLSKAITLYHFLLSADDFALTVVLVPLSC